jgi:ADP-ribose pyrophosphatase YjhB (NUDIX family)
VLRDQKVLFIRETRDHVWGIPWGYVEGTNDDGTPDPPEKAAIRETFEEAGVSAEVVGLVGVQNHVSRQGRPHVYMIFLCRHVAGEPQPDNRETDRALYLSLEQINTWPESIDDFVKWVVTRVLTDQFVVLKPHLNNPYSPYLGFF